MQNKIILKSLAALIATALVSACGVGGGGGGGGSDEEESNSNVNIIEPGGNPAEVSLRVEPSNIDAGDITTVEIRVTDVTKPFILKIRHHANLMYLDQSMVFFAEGSSSAIATTPKDYTGAAETNYLVETFVSAESFGKKAEGLIILNFQGIAKAEDDLAIDVDEYNTAAPSSSFDLDNPQFSALDKVSVKIEDDQIAEEEVDEEDEDEESEDDTSEEDDASEEDDVSEDDSTSTDDDTTT